MGLLDSFERGLERAVNGAFAKTFRSGIQPVEIASALRRELDTKAAVVSRDRILAPNEFTVRLNPSDEERMARLGGALHTEPDQMVRKHASSQGYSFAGPVRISLRADDAVAAGTISVESRSVEGDVSWQAVVEIGGRRLAPPQQRVPQAHDRSPDVSDQSGSDNSALTRASWSRRCCSGGWVENSAPIDSRLMAGAKKNALIACPSRRSRFGMRAISPEILTRADDSFDGRPVRYAPLRSALSSR